MLDKDKSTLIDQICLMYMQVFIENSVKLSGEFLPEALIDSALAFADQYVHKKEAKFGR